ncbi:MAG: PspC domain-containing protein [Prolixibacteraceae bacterium]
MKRFTRSNNKIVAGVISGISTYVNPEIDPVIFRIIFATATFFQPQLILIYLGLMLIMPAEDVSYSK